MSMKKLAAVALSGALLASGATFGMDFDPKFYIGAEGQVNKYKGAKEVKTKAGTVLKDTVNNKSLFGKSGGGASLFAGSRLTDNVGVELGYTHLTGGKFSLKTPAYQNSSLKTKNHNMYADVLGYVPVTEDMDVIGSLGIGRLATKVNGKVVGPNSAGVRVTEATTLKSSKTGLRVGLGAQYKVTPEVGARFMVRHQKGNQFVKSVNSAGLGLFYQF